MALLQKNAFGLDISDFSIEALSLDKKMGKLKVASYGRLELPEGIIKDGVVLQKEKLVEAVKQVIQEAEPKAIKSDKVILSLPESRVFTHVFQFPANLNEQQIAECLPYEAEKIIPYQSRQLYFDFQIIEQNEKFREVFYAACPKQIVESFMEVLAEAGLDPVAFDMESQAQARALLGDLSLELEGVLMADIGARTTILSIFDHHGIRSTVNIPYAGQRLTAAVAKKLKTSPEEAEKLKKEVGIEMQVKQKNKVYLAIEPVLQKIATEIKSSVKYYKKQTGHIINEVILCGGSSLLPGIESYFSQALDLKVEKGNPLEEISFDPKTFNAPEAVLYATVIGLAMRAMAKDPEREGVNLVYRDYLAAKPKKEKPKPSLAEPKVQPRPSAKNKKRTFILLGIFLVLLLALAGLGLWKKPFSQNKNTNIKPVNQVVNTNAAPAEKTKIDLETTLEINTASQVLETQIAGQILEKEIEKTQTFSTTGRRTANGRASGRVKIYNNSNQNQSLVATTRLLTADNILYRLKNQVVVPAKGSVEADIYADQEGEQFETGPGKFTIPGLSTSLQKLIYAESTTATSGGSQEIMFLTQADIDKAQTDLKNVIAKEAIDNLKSGVTAGQVLLETVVNQVVESSTASQKVDAAVNDFTLTMKIKNQALTFSQTDINKKLNEQLAKQLPSGQKTDNYKIDNIQYSLVKYEADKNLASVQVKAEAKL